MNKGRTIHDPVVITSKEKIHIGDGVRIDSFCKLSGGEGLNIGDFVHIASFCDINVGGGELVIGDGSSLSTHVIICTGQSVIAEGKSPSAQHKDFKKLTAKVTIGKNVMIFAGAIILPGVTIGDGAVIAAGAIIRNDVPARTLWAGVPAKKIKDL